MEVLRGYAPREYHVVKIKAGKGSRFLVVAEDLDDPDIWTVITTTDTALEGWQYVAEVTARNRALARAVGCNP